MEISRVKNQVTLSGYKYSIEGRYYRYYMENHFHGYSYHPALSYICNKTISNANARKTHPMHFVLVKLKILFFSEIILQNVYFEPCCKLQLQIMVANVLGRLKQQNGHLCDINNKLCAVLQAKLKLQASSIVVFQSIK